ncbi:MAG: hypothetical protein KF891_01440 [Rhizobacter sp.]|nr:hypothetical protein [Rhizobacter sp.]
MRTPPSRAWPLAALLCLPLCLPILAHAAPAAMSDDDLAGVCGQDGIGLAVHLELNSAAITDANGDSRLTAGFTVDGTTTYAVVHKLGGVLDLIGITLGVHTRPDGGDYIDLGLPGFVGMKQFGFRALTAQTDPNALLTPSASYGQVLFNGTATMTGHLYLWAQ